ncbi:MAG: carboxymuconolactone decarboxylase family protein [bacterium]|nr:4-carboxymuconolactone decarboxylase [Deltaproteobacteria bacterium]MCP4907447.1 carboxymuconolactone decarboxylase family protein [bacterium]
MNEEEREQMIGQIAELLPLPKEIEKEFATLTADTVMGALWSRTGIASRERSMITIAALTALERPHELEIHLGLGLDNGLSREEICEVIMHMAVYGGWPVAVEGMRAAKKVFEARDAS